MLYLLKGKSYKVFENISTSKAEKKIKVGIDNLFDELSIEAGFDISAIFIGLGINLDFIYYDIDRYRNYAKNNKIIIKSDFKKYAVKSGRRGLYNNHNVAQL